MKIQRVRLPSGRLSASRASAAGELRMIGEGAAFSRDGEVVRKLDRQLVDCHWDDTATLTVHDRNRRSPRPLSRNREISRPKSGSRPLLQRHVLAAQIICWNARKTIGNAAIRLIDRRYAQDDSGAISGIDRRRYDHWHGILNSRYIGLCTRGPSRRLGPALLSLGGRLLLEPLLDIKILGPMVDVPVTR